MALPTSGPLSINDIRTELGVTQGSLRYLSGSAGFFTPDSISEFYGYSNAIDVSFLLYIDSTNSYRDAFALYPNFSTTYSTNTYLYVSFQWTINSPYGNYIDGGGRTFGPFRSGTNAPLFYPPMDAEGGDFIQSIDNVYVYYFVFGSGSDLNITSFNY